MAAEPIHQTLTRTIFHRKLREGAKMAKTKGNKWRGKNVAEQKLITPRQAAAILGLSLRRLQLWRHHGGGPPYIHKGKFALYPLSDLKRWKSPPSLDKT